MLKYLVNMELFTADLWPPDAKILFLLTNHDTFIVIFLCQILMILSNRQSVPVYCQFLNQERHNPLKLDRRYG